MSPATQTPFSSAGGNTKGSVLLFLKCRNVAKPVTMKGLIVLLWANPSARRHPSLLPPSLCSQSMMVEMKAGCSAFILDLGGAKKAFLESSMASEMGGVPTVSSLLLLAALFLR